MTFDQLHLWSKEFALIWFFVLFVVIVLWVYRPGGKRTYDAAARGILDDEDEKEQT